jgi:hypothetical protein
MLASHTQGASSLATASPQTFVEHLKHQMWTTKGARFNADRRLRAQNEWSQRAIACLSVYLAVLSLVIIIPAFGVSTANQTKLSVAVAALSLVLVVLSLLEGGRNYLVRAERLHRCAMSIGALLSDVELELARSGTPGLSDRLGELAHEYHYLLNTCQENHSNGDFELFRATHRAEFVVSRLQSIWIHVSWWVRWYGLHAGAVILPPCIAIWYVCANA